MPSKDPTLKLRQQAENASKRYSELADNLSNRIQALEEWINGLPSKTVVVSKSPDKDDPGANWFLSIQRASGGRWRIWYAHASKGTDYSQLAPELLCAAPLQRKVLLIPYLADLLRAFAEEQESKAVELAWAHRKLDGLFDELGFEKGSK